jgi:hypothetical protein
MLKVYNSMRIVSKSTLYAYLRHCGVPISAYQQQPASKS